MDTYSDQKRTAVEVPTLNNFIEGISSSRSRIEDGTVTIMRQLERLGFHQPQPTAPQKMMGGVNSTQLVPRERTALEALEYQATALKTQANAVEFISQLLNNQF